MDTSRRRGWRHRFGRAIESLVEAHLLEHDCELLARRYARPGGEIDLVVRDGDDVVFVEVKARHSTRYGDPIEAVGARKQRRLARTARRFLREHELCGRRCRFDVVGVVVANGQARIEWLRDAFRP